jgi:hypothetical protein
MGKKLGKTRALDAIVVAPVDRTAQAEQAREAAFHKAHDEANAKYHAAMSGAWQRYVTGLAADLRENPRKKTGGTPYDKRYDKEREAAVKEWRVFFKSD